MSPYLNKVPVIPEILFKLWWMLLFNKRDFFPMVKDDPFKQKRTMMRPIFLLMDEAETMQKIAAEQVPWDSSLTTCNVYCHRKGSDLNRKTAGLIFLPETSVIFEVVAYSPDVMCLFPKKVLFSFQLILFDWSVIPELKSFCYLSMILMSTLI